MVVFKHIVLGTGFDSRREKRRLITFLEEEEKVKKVGGREHSSRVP